MTRPLCANAPALDCTKLHAYILELACTDGGAAGTALSVVPRYVRAISAPYQWDTPQTVRLPKRIRALTPTQPTTSADSVQGQNSRARGTRDHAPVCNGSLRAAQVVVPGDGRNA